MSVEPSYPHLHPAARELADAPDEVRIRRIRMDRWIGYTRAEAALLALEDLLSFPQRTRMPNVLLVGPTNNGKTMIVEKFRRTHLPIEARTTASGAASIPVLKVQMPPAPDERRFFSAVLDALGAPSRPTDQLTAKQDMTLRLMRATDVRILVIDEIHNVLSGRRDQQRRFLNLLRWLGNELQISLVAVGTAEALRAIQSDDQLANRFTPFALPPWHDGGEYRRLLSTLEAVLPLRRPSGLAEAALSQKILAGAEGILGEVVAIVVGAAVRAIVQGAEEITADAIGEGSFISPSARRRIAI